MDCAMGRGGLVCSEKTGRRGPTAREDAHGASPAPVLGNVVHPLPKESFRV